MAILSNDIINLLIPTMPDDAHAIYVHLAMQQKGHNSLLWHTADFPTQQTHSFELSNNEIHWTAQGRELSISNQIFDVVWFRRPRAPMLSENLHPEDQVNSKKGKSSFFSKFLANYCAKCILD